MERKHLKDKKITVYRRDSGVNENGYRADCYRPIHPGTLWAYVRQLSGKELFLAHSFQAEEEILFSVNWRADLTTENCLSLFIEHKGAWYDVTRVDTYEGYKSDIRLYAKTMRSVPDQSPMSNEELVALIQKGERERLPELWEQVGTFVSKQAGKRARLLDGYGGVTAEDLYHSGYIALVDAADSYDPATGCAFTSWLMFFLMPIFAKTGGYYSSKRDPLHRACSLDAPLKVEKGKPITLSNFLPDPCAAQNFQDVEDRIWVEQLRAALDAALVELPADQAEALRLRYYSGQTLKQAGENVGVHKMTISRREKRALQALRKRQELRQFL